MTLQESGLRLGEDKLFDVGSADWLFWFDATVLGLISRKTFRRFLFWEDGRKTSDTEGRAQLDPTSITQSPQPTEEVPPPVETTGPAMPLTTTETSTTTVAPAAPLDPQSEFKSRLVSFSVVDGFLDVGSPEWFWHFTKDVVHIVHRVTLRRFAFSLFGSWGDSHGTQSTGKFPQPNPPRWALDAGRLEVGSPDWLLYFDPQFCAFVHKGTHKRHVFTQDGKHVRDDNGKQQVDPPSTLDNGLRLTNRRLDVGSPDWLLYFDSQAVALINKSTFNRLLFWSDGRHTVDSLGRE